MKFSFSRSPVFPSSRLLVFLVVVILLIAQSVFAQIKIPDPNLRTALRDALEIPEEQPITQQDMLRLTVFRANQREITDLTGLEFATNITHLSLGGNKISDLTPLSAMRKLQSLTLWENRIDSVLDLSPLSNLAELTRLGITDSRIEDLTPLTNLTQLDWLSLWATGIEDISPLSNLRKLRFLRLNDNRIVDVSPLANLTQLEKLHITRNRIVDVSPLANLTQLKELYITRNWIVDVSPLANLTQLEKLHITRNRIVDVSPLANLTQLEELYITRNHIVDFSPLQRLSLINFQYDQVCMMPGLPLQNRIENRNLPSIHQGWHNGINTVWDDVPTLARLPFQDRIAYHDLYWHHIPFRLRFQQIPPWSRLVGDLDTAIMQRDELLAKNPNMIFLAQIKINSASDSVYPEDWFGWVRDENGNPVRSDPDLEDHNLIDMRLPEVHDLIVQQAVAVSQCGLYDGIMFDFWPAESFTLTSYHADGSVRARERVEKNITLPIVQRIRQAVPDDFLILCNRNRYKLPLTAPYVNGSSMETHPADREKPYTRADIIEIETNLIWLEQNLREPQINCLQGQGIRSEPPDSLNNRRWMRLFTTMSLTLSDGYVVYTTGRWFQEHIWYPFWDANLGQPISPTAQRYQGIDGLYIREFTNGWAVYNRSGTTQTISLSQSTIGVSSNKQDMIHLLPDLDGEIYLKSRSRADVNRDGKVNVLDLILVQNGFGKTELDLNDDGVVNILDLVFVSEYLSVEK